MTPAGDERGERFELFRAQVLATPPLLARLRAAPDVPSFVAASVEEARGLGIPLTAAEVEAALSLARRDWIERWIQ